MPTVATAYSTRFDYADEIPRSRGAVLSCPLEKDGVVVEADSGTFTLVDAAGNTITTGNVTPSSAHTATFEVLPPALTDRVYGYEYMVRWELVDGAETIYAENECGIVRQVLPLPVSQTDLLKRHSDLAAYLQGTGETDFDKWMLEAWAECVRWMQRQARRPSAILSPSQFKELGTYWALELFFGDLSTGTEEGSPYRLEHDRYKAKRAHLQGQIAWRADEDQDGAMDADDLAGPAVIFLGTHGMPTRRRRVR